MIRALCIVSGTALARTNALSSSSLSRTAAAATFSPVRFGHRKANDPKTRDFEKASGKGGAVRRAVRHIHYHWRRTGRVYREDVEAAIVLAAKAAASDDGGVLDKDGDDLIKCCGGGMVDVPKAERAQIALRAWQTLMGEGAGFQPTVSHFRTLLHVQMANEHPLSAEDFLSEMASRGLAPDGKTYEMLVLARCRAGDLAGAEELVDSMVADGNAAGKAVRDAMVVGYVKAGKADLVEKEVFQEMSNRLGVAVTAKTQAIFITELIRSGAPWKTVQDQMTSAEQDGHAFHFRDLAAMLVGLVHRGEHDAARDVLERLRTHRKEPFYGQAVRNLLPDLISASESDPSFSAEAFERLGLPALGSSRGDTERDHGHHLLQRLVGLKTSPEKAASVIAELCRTCDHDGPVLRAVEHCIVLGETDYARSLMAELRLRRKWDRDVLADNPMLDAFVRRQMEHLSSALDVAKFVVRLNQAGVRPTMNSLSQDILPKYLRSPEMNGLPVATALGQLMGALLGQAGVETTSWTYILNGGIRVLLTEASQAGLDEAALLLLSNRHNHLLPTYWSASLARAFLATGDEDALVAVLFRSTLGMSSHQVKKSGDWSSAAFSALLHIQRQAHTYGKSADGVLKSVLVRLKRERIGVPQVVASELNSHTDDQEIDSMLKLLGEIHDCRGNVWPRRAIDTRLQELLDNRLRQAAEGGVHNRIEALESAYDAHLDSGLCKRTLLSDLAVALAEAGRAERLRALLAEARGRNVVPFPGLADKIVAELLRLELVDEATELVLEMGGGAGMNFRTAARLCQALVERDRIEDAKRILKPKTDYHESAEKSVHLRPVMTQLAETGNPVNVRDFLAFLVAEGLVSPTDPASLSSLVDVHVANGALREAVDAVHSVYETHGGVLPNLSRLMRALIVTEDLQKMQEMVALAKEARGERWTLFFFCRQLLETGRLTQARSLLGSPGIRYGHAEVQALCESLQEDGKREELEAFVLAASEMAGADSAYLYSRLLNAHLDDPDKLEEVLKRMQQKGLAVTPADAAVVRVCFQSRDRAVPTQLMKQLKAIN